MSDMPEVTREQLLKLIDELEKHPTDKLRIMGDAGITILGATLGGAAAGTLAAAAGVTSIVGITTAASWIGFTLVATTPIGWIAGSAVAAGAVAYGVTRLIRGGGLAEGRKAELLQVYREEARGIEAKERAGTIASEDRTRFILSLRELIDKNFIPPTNAFRLIEQVEQGRIALSQAFELIQLLLQNAEVETTQSPAIEDHVDGIPVEEGSPIHAITNSRDAFDVVKKKSGEALDITIDVAYETFNVVKKKSGEAMELTSHVASGAYRRASETASDTYQKLSDSAERAARRIRKKLEKRAPKPTKGQTLKPWI